MATKRKTRKTDKAEAELAAFSNSNIDKLLVAQAAYEYGTNAWTLVADKLSKHALTSKPIVYTPQVVVLFFCATYGATSETVLYVYASHAMHSISILCLKPVTPCEHHVDVSHT
jgi:hypothetical protein